MSEAPIMVDCPGCSFIKFRGGKHTNEGIVVRKVATIYYQDICTKCGGSGRVAR